MFFWWEKGKNLSRRVKGDEARRLRQGIAEMDCFKHLYDDYAETTVAMTEELEKEHEG